MRYFTTSQIRAALLLCVLAAAGWGIRYHIAAGQRNRPLPFAPWPGDSAALAAVDSVARHANSPVDVNSATSDELQRLPGIGPGLAGRIIDERGRGGPFDGLEQLAGRVRGIGPATASSLEGRVTFSPPDSTNQESNP